ncbi:DUF7683 domain-containing protein [Pseudomonas sp. NFX15]|uniref:DUF7683 domain-containing protein n=1 Tax=Pseudomonas sp. NFX15 TaxID=2816958 RepID=UPI003BA20CCC
MNHVIYAFDKKTEELSFEVHIPSKMIEKLRKIMGWVEAEDEIYGYDLDSHQIEELQIMLNRAFLDPQYLFQIVGHSDE